MDAGGTLTRFAGNGRAGNSGDGGPASAAQLSFPMGIAVDAAGNVYVADRDASVVRKIAANGTISTVAGTGTAGFAGDGGAAVAAQLNGPFGVAVDASGDLYIADTSNQVVRKVSADGTISTVAGTGMTGYAGDGGAARNAWLNGPESVAVDASGNLYIADTFNGRVRRVGVDGTISTAAGVGSTGVYSGDGGPANLAGISLPTDVAVDRAGNLYIADFGNGRIRVVTNGIITTAAGRNDGAPLMEGEAAVNVRLEGPTGVTVDASGSTIYFVQAGIGSGTGLAVGNYKIWKVSAAGVLSTFAGTGSPSYSGDGGMATAAQLSGPAGVAVSASGLVYIADTQNQRVRAVSPGGTISTLAGTGAAGFNGEIVSPRTALLNLPHGLAADALGNWYVADTANNRVRKVQPGGNLFTIAGNGNASYFGDGGPGTMGSVNQPQGVAADAAGNVYIADTLNHAVRKVTPDGVIRTLAGTGNPGYSGDGGPANQARLSLPSAVAVDANGNVYVADTGNNQVRRIDSLGTITTVDTGGIVERSAGSGGGSRGQRVHRRHRQSPRPARVAGRTGNYHRGQQCVLLLGRWRTGVECDVEPAMGRRGGCGRERLRDGRGEQFRADAGAGVGGPHGERGDECGKQSAGSGVAGRTGGAVRHGARRGADGPVQWRGRAAAVCGSGAGGRGGAIRRERRAGTGGGAECGRGVSARDGGDGGDRARVIHGGRLGCGTGRGSESGRDAERDGGSGGGGLGAVAVCDGGGADRARGRGWEVGRGAAAAAGGSSYGEDRRRGRGGAIRGRGGGPDRRRDAGQRGGAPRAGRRRARGGDGGRRGEPGGRYGGGAVGARGRQSCLRTRFPACPGAG